MSIIIRKFNLIILCFFFLSCTEKHAPDLKSQQQVPAGPVEITKPVEDAPQNKPAIKPEKEAKKDHRKVVLVTTGSFNPVHLSHIALLEKAKMALTQKGYDVAAGIISPSYDPYLKNKMLAKLKEDGVAHPTPEQIADVFASAPERLMLISCAIKSLGLSDWVFPSAWESTQKNFISFPEVALHFLEQLKSQSKKGEIIEVWFVMGEDLAARAGSPAKGLNASGTTIPVVVVKREGENTGFKCQDPKKCILIESNESDLSSTAVRKKFAELKKKPHDSTIINELEKLIGRDVLVTILEKGWYGLEETRDKIELSNPHWKGSFSSCPIPPKDVLPLILNRF